MESRHMSIENMAMHGTKHKKSLSVSSQSSFDSCSTYFTDEEELDDFEEDFAVPETKNESGIFLSAHARNILKRCAASDGNLLHSTNTTSARPSKLTRRGSLGTSSSTKANATFDTGGAATAALIACIQTKSAIAANPFLQQTGFGRRPKPL